MSLTAEWIIALILGGAGAISAIWNIYEQLRDRKRDVLKQESGLTLTAEQSKRIAAEAAKLNQDRIVEQERWWLEQFQILKQENSEIRKELDEERRFRWRVSRALRDHMPWDWEVVEKLRQHDIDMSDPPPLYLDPDSPPGSP